MYVIIPHKNKKVQSIFNKYGEISFSEFFGLFTYKYPLDWKNVLNTFNQMDKKRKTSGSSLTPDKYMENLYK